LGKINQKNKEELFVLIRADSFFYGTNSSITADITSGLLGDLKSFLSDHQHSSIKLWGDFPESFLIAPLYWDYYKGLNELPEVYFYHSTNIPYPDALLNVPVPLAIHQLIAQQHPNLNWNFLGAQLIELSFHLGGNTTFFSVFLCSHQFCLVYGREGSIQLYNWINIQGIEDVVYYLALALQSFQLKGTDVQLFIDGYGYSDFSVLKKYFPQMVLKVEENEKVWLNRILQWYKN
jgi:hypothetical protein